MAQLILFYVTVVLHVVACLFLIGVVLLQQGKGQDLASAFGGGGSQAAFGPRGSANVLSRATTVLAGVFMVTSLTLSLIRPQRSSVLERLPAASASPTAAPAAAGTPAAATPLAATPAPAAATPAPAATPGS